MNKDIKQLLIKLGLHIKNYEATHEIEIGASIEIEGSLYIWDGEKFYQA